MPLLVPAGWACEADVEGDLRHRLRWIRGPSLVPMSERVVGVVMYNPGLEGVRVAGGVLDGATHRRVRDLLHSATEIRVANLSPVRGTKPALARKACAAIPFPGALSPAQDDALRWACDPPEVVVAWGAGTLTDRMVASRARVLSLAEGRLWCWGKTAAGHPFHPSPLGCIAAGAVLVRF